MTDTPARPRVDTPKTPPDKRHRALCGSCGSTPGGCASLHMLNAGRCCNACTHQEGTTAATRVRAVVDHVLGFVLDGDDEIRVRWTRRGPNTLRAWRCDACPDAADCDHIAAVRAILTKGATA